MFGFARKKDAAPVLCPGNPGIGTEIPFAVPGGEPEAVDAVELLAAALEDLGLTVERADGFVRHPDSGFVLTPQLVSGQPVQGAVQSITTVQVNHPDLVPAGAFEYQHSTGATLAESVGAGFGQWGHTDLVPLLHALSSDSSDCTALVLNLPAEDGKPARTRRAVLGPVAHLALDRPEPDPGDEHPFCPCCLLTQSFKAFKDLVTGDDFAGVRLFAMRDEDGSATADCRVNGLDYEPGMEALREYVRTWPGTGLEFRKQYVVLQTIPTPAE